MPYVPKERRGAEEYQVVFGPDEGAGDLNFMFTLVLQDYLRAKGLSYQTINDVVGALEGAKAEFQRRVVAPYEDDAMELNGDVYAAGFVNGKPNKNLREAGPLKDETIASVQL